MTTLKTQSVQLAILASVSLIVGCSLVIEPDFESFASRDSGTDPMWGCVGNIPPPPTSMGGVTRRWRQRYLLINTDEPVPELRLTVCDNSDIQCSSPVGANLRPTATGLVETFVPDGFEGYVIATSTVTTDSVFHLGDPVLEDTEQVGTFQLFPQGQIDQIIASLGINQVPGRVTFLVIAVDCRNQPAAGAVINTATLDSESLVVYVDSFLPNPMLSETTGSGIAVIFNHPTGITTVTIQRSVNEQVTAQRAVFVRENLLNYIALPPTPLSSGF